MNGGSDPRRSWLGGVFGVPDLPERVVDFHRSFWPAYGDQYKRMVDEVHRALEEIPVHNPYFNDHGSRHSARILENVALLEQEFDFDLNETERYLLASSAWLHDIGMSINKRIDLSEISIGEDTQTEWFQEVGTTRDGTATIDDPERIRKWHHVLSWNFVRRKHERLGFPNFRVADTVADICRVHRRRSDTSSLEPRRTFDVSSVRQPVGIRTVAALLQFGDALDVNKDRAPEISSYVQRLPPESQKHWHVCQLITGFDVDTDDNALVITASHNTEHDRELLAAKAEHLFEEYEDVRTVLATPPLEIFLTDVVVESIHEKDFNVGVSISGRERYLEKLGRKSMDIREAQMAQFADTNNEWVIRIENGRGDATVSRTTTMELVEDVDTRTHFVRSFDTPMEWDWGEDVRAYDDEQELELRVETDRPNNKRFEVVFPRNLSDGDTYTYTYEYFWEELFPRDEEVYVVTGNADRMEFELHYPEGMDLSEVRCEERHQNQTALDEVTSGFNREAGVIRGEVEKQNPMNQVHIRWSVS